ncbi:cytosolic sulfotransferase 5-like [Lycium ferocissimum]|uniref:cytosolic sulfotransferase 5-like n=1 Tax=Lycium ferocissimum TaxID=112874 RepID=UPI0028159BB5|nr:cytosolic sulfotransferase 5-like [Lycium ferocissimum]
MEGSNSDNMSEEEFCTFVSRLPREKWWETSIAMWEGYWYKNDSIKAAMAGQSGFLVRDDDVILASSMKTGTTWLKALIPFIMAHNRSTVDDINIDPLLTNHPNQLMPSIELSIFSPKNLNSKVFNVDEMDSPKLFRTHLPYSKLPETIKSSSSSCKLVYITRDPKDVFVSLWHFMNSINNTTIENWRTIDEAFGYFCRGIHPFGPFHDHVLEYWKESLKNPEKILFLRYESLGPELSKDTIWSTTFIAETEQRAAIAEQGIAIARLQNGGDKATPGKTKSVVEPRRDEARMAESNGSGASSSTEVLRMLETLAKRVDSTEKRVETYNSRVDQIPGAPPILKGPDSKKYIQRPFPPSAAQIDPEEKDEIESVFFEKVRKLRQGSIDLVRSSAQHSITSFEMLADAFIKAHAGAKKVQARKADIFRIAQRDDELLREFVNRFQRERMELPPVPRNGTKLSQRGLNVNNEEMKKDLKGQVKKLAEFLGRPFANDNEDQELHKVVERCSLERLKNLQVNKNIFLRGVSRRGQKLEPWLGIPKIAYFRNGLVGDFKNTLSDEMQQRLDQITCQKFEGTGLDF